MATTISRPETQPDVQPHERWEPDLLLRSPNGGWNGARWEKLPNDGNRYEVIDGILYMSTAPAVFHQWIIRQIARLLFPQVDDADIGIVLWSPVGLFMPGCDPVQPDILVIRSTDNIEYRDGRIHGVPALLIEVQSPSNPTYDSRTKREAYARAGVPEYWIVRPRTRDVLVLSSPDASLGDYTASHLFDETTELQSPSLPIRLPVQSLFADAPDTTL